MCHHPPGPRCATHARGTAGAELHRYEATHPDGPSVDPLTAAVAAATPRATDPR